MLDFGFTEMMIIGVVALVVVGPEKLPTTARAVGRYVGKLQRYIRDIKAEIDRSAELQELQKMKQDLESSAREIEQSARELEQKISDDSAQIMDDLHHAYDEDEQTWESDYPIEDSPPVYIPPRKNWRSRRSAMPRWYRQRHGLRGHVQSGAARVARHRPRSW